MRKPKPVLYRDARSVGSPSATGGGMVGVTFQNIDGGSTYYASSGFTFPAAFPAKLPQTGNAGPTITGGWDSPLFFPIGDFLADTTATANIDKYIAANENVCWLTFAGTSVTNNTYCRTNNFSMVATASDPPQGPSGAETVGIIESDEPGGYFTNPGGPSAKVIFPYVNSTVPNASGTGTYFASLGQDGRFWYLQMQNLQLLNANFLSDAPNPKGGRKVLSTAITTPNGITSRIPGDVFSWDEYWISSSRTDPPFTAHNQQFVGGINVSPSVDQTGRGNWYGDMVDFNRRLCVDAGLNIPQYQLVDTGNGAAGSFTANNIYSFPSGPEINWAIWASIVHGCRGITYFPNIDPSSTNPLKGFTGLLLTHDNSPRVANITSGTIANGASTLTVNTMGGGTFDNIPFNAILTWAGQTGGPVYILAQLTAVSPADGGTGTYLLNRTISPGVTNIAMVATSPGSSSNTTTAYPLGINTQITQTNRQVRDMARLINSQFAIGYAWVSPAGYLFPHAMNQAPAIGSNGIDLMVKHYTGASYTSLAGDAIDTNAFYIFATTRSSNRNSNISATFHIADFGATSVTVLSDGVVAARTITITTPGQFTDVFDYAWTVRIYKVNGPQTGAASVTTKTIFLTSGTSWTVPSDWNPANANSFELIGGGGSGAGGEFHSGGSGGGGGEYRKIVNQGSTHFQANDVVTIQIGAGGAAGVAGVIGGGSGTATFIKDRTNTIIAQANGGTRGTNAFNPPLTAIGGPGGTGGTGTTGFDGGAGATATGSLGNVMGGSGGGAGGPNGVGGAGFCGPTGQSAGGAGGGAGGGGTTGFLFSDPGAIGGQGGMNINGYGGGAGASPNINGDDGFWGGGGGGGGSSQTLLVGGKGGTGGAGNEWTSTLGVIGGSGGGGGAGGGNAGAAGTAGAGGDGGLYGGGGGGGAHGTGGSTDANGGAGAAGIIVITYQP